MATYKIIPLKVGEAIEPEPYILYLGDCRKMVKIYDYFWLIKGNGMNLLVDCGFSRNQGLKFAPNLKQSQNEDPLYLLRTNGLEPQDIDDVILTHAHWDHLSPLLSKYSKAKVYIQAKELEAVINPPHPWFANFIFLNTIRNLARDKKRLRIVQGEQEILPGIKLFWTGGHTPGHQSIEVKTEAGWVIIAGDVLFTYQNLKQDIPVGFNSNLLECFQAMARIRKEKAIILPGHDPEVKKRYPRGIG